MVEAIDLAVEQNPHPLPGWTAQHMALDGGSEESGDWSREAEQRNATLAANDPGVVAYIGPYATGATAVSLPVTNKAGLLQLAPTVTWPGLTMPGWDPGEPDKYYPTGKRTFARLMPDDSLQAVEAATWAKEEGARRVTVLSDGSSYSDGLARYFIAVAPGQMISVTGRLAVSQATAAVLVSELAKDKPDAIFFAPSNVGGAVLFARALQGTRLYSGVFVTDVALSSQLIEQVGPDLPGWHFVFNGDPEAPTAQPGFVAAFEAKYGQMPSQFALNAWLLAKETLQAVSATGGTDRAKIASWVLTSGNGTCLTCASFDANGDPITWRMTGYLLKGGRFESVWRGQVGR